MMIEMYLNICGVLAALFCPLYSFWTWITVAAVDTDALAGLVTFFSWVALFHDPNLFPLYVSLTLDIFILSFLVSLVMSFIRWIMDVIPLL